MEDYRWLETLAARGNAVARELMRQWRDDPHLIDLVPLWRAGGSKPEFVPRDFASEHHWIDCDLDRALGVDRERSFIVSRYYATKYAEQIDPDLRKAKRVDIARSIARDPAEAVLDMIGSNGTVTIPISGSLYFWKTRQLPMGRGITDEAVLAEVRNRLDDKGPAEREFTLALAKRFLQVAYDRP